MDPTQHRWMPMKITACSAVLSSVSYLARKSKGWLNQNGTYGRAGREQSVTIFPYIANLRARNV